MPFAVSERAKKDDRSRVSESQIVFLSPPRRLPSADRARVPNSGFMLTLRSRLLPPSWDRVTIATTAFNDRNAAFPLKGFPEPLMVL